MIPFVAKMPRWMSSILADAHPSQAFETVVRAATLRGEPLVEHLAKADANEILRSGREGVSYGYSREAFAATMETYSRWIHSGSPEIQLDEKAQSSLSQLSTPRFHPLTRMDGEGKTYLFEDRRHGWVLNILVQATSGGPRVDVFAQRSDSDKAPLFFKLFSGHWDILRWHGREWEKVSEAVGVKTIILRMMIMCLNAVAAIEESREVIRQLPAVRKSNRKSRKRRVRLKTPKSHVYWLSPNALDAWVKKSLAASQSSINEGSSRGTRTGKVRLHNVAEYYRLTWVLRPEEGEAILEVGEGRLRKDGSRATLYCVKRLIESYERGEDVAPQTLQVKGVV